ncbi:MAG: anaerobic ribonucleoside-triphosphate reductase activating protein [Candidatus Schekmanbacteria bacterium]|nr:anaerobic ribonucleoside-triphosphate reductase activating protein [Candidatus Schekmanbacteria bacterium]
MYPIKGFIETSFLDWPGKVAAVVFLPGCNFRCPYCHNHELVLRPQTLLNIPLDNILERLKGFKGWIDGVVISGGEPTLQGKLPELIGIFKQEGFLVKLDTNGSRPDLLEQLISKRLLDYIAMDVKAPLDDLHYRRVTGKAVDVRQIRKSCDLLMSSPIEYEFRTTICPALLNLHDCEDLFAQLSGAKKLTLQNFNPHSTLDPKLQDIAPLSAQEMQALLESAKKWVKSCRVAG